MYLRITIVTVALGLLSAWAQANPVTLGDREWRQLRDFNSVGGVSWDDMSSACNSSTGVCSGQLKGVDVNGWVWADANDVNAMLNIHLPASAPGSSAIWTDMGPGPDSAATRVDFWARRWATLGFGANVTHYQLFAPVPVFSLWAGWLRDDPGALATVLTNFAPYPGVPDAFISTNSSWATDETQYPGDPFANTYFGLGAFLYRPIAATVPVPGSAWLLCLSLVLLRAARPATRRGECIPVQ